MTNTREELAATQDDAQWEWLRAHLERGGLIQVSVELDLVEVALKVAQDDAAAIEAWIKAGAIGKPSMSEIETWDLTPTLVFSMIIVSPYILFQQKHQNLQ